jgi:hypothetical protein
MTASTLEDQAAELFEMLDERMSVMEEVPA